MCTTHQLHVLYIAFIQATWPQHIHNTAIWDRVRLWDTGAAAKAVDHKLMWRLRPVLVPVPFQRAFNSFVPFSVHEDLKKYLQACHEEVFIYEHNGHSRVNILHTVKKMLKM